MSSFLNFTNYIKKNAQALAAEVVESVLRKANVTIPDWEKEQAVKMYVELFGFFGESIVYEEKEEVPDTLLAWSKKNAAMQVSAEGNISEIVVRYPPTRDVFIDLFTQISIKLGLSVQENAFVIKRINTMLDISLNETIFAFERLSEQFKEETKKELAKLSAPIVPVKDGVVVLPLIGDIDPYRASYLLDHVLPQIGEMDIHYVIADFSGILTINMRIAEYLHQMGNMLRLMGIHVITTGLRPELVQTIVNSKINILEIEAFATVKQALESIK